jgi:hypothetical protein
MRTPTGDVVQYTSGATKAKALHKSDLSPSSKQLDVRETTIVDVLVSPMGEVVCLKALAVLSRQVELALSSWRFEPAQLESLSPISAVWNSPYVTPCAVRLETL